ncbi:MAG: fimbrillin family protein [Bacteroidaceae bacterium]|nr:fimbrillin family protein [Bacteroidaceae bacterium]
MTVAEHLLHFVEDGIERLFENALGDASVSSIILRNVSNKGEYYFESSSWSDVSGSKYYTLANSDMNITTASQALSSNYLFVIPQKRDANGITGTYLDITYTISGQEAKNTTIPLAVDWQAGKQYTINIKLGTSTII